MAIIKNLIFDLGGVILDLAVEQTLLSFAQLSGLEPAEVLKRFRESKGFEMYEKGLLDDDQFRQFVKEVYGIPVSDEEIDRCWNAMLLTIPPGRLEWLMEMKKQYRTFLLSNTNTIHLDYLNTRILPAMGGLTNLDSYFEKAYYSHFMGMRKPEAEIFMQVLTENNLVAAETLFLDDNADNVEGARKVGLQALLVVTNNLDMSYFNNMQRGA